MPKIEVKNVYKIFGTEPSKVLPMCQEGATKEDILENTGHTVGLADVSLSIEEGETFVCMGLSGSGKSTLIRHINRLIDPTAGEVFVEGINVMQLNQKNLIKFRRHKMSMVFQRFGLFPHKTVIQNIAYGLEVQGKEINERNKVAMEKIEAVGLNGFEYQYPNQLSGGMQQRVGLARALATNTDIMLMDEAFSALDPLIRSDMQKQLIELQAEPWGPIPYQNLSKAERDKTMNVKKFGEIIEFARQTGFREFYLWGMEWWYWEKQVNNDPQMWEKVKTLFK